MLNMKKISILQENGFTLDRLMTQVKQKQRKRQKNAIQEIVFVHNLSFQSLGYYFQMLLIPD